MMTARKQSLARAFSVAISVALTVTPRPALAQGASEPVDATFRTREAQLLEQVHAAETQEGIQSASLIEPLTALGLVYQEWDEPVRAAQAFERARQVVRFNYGFSTPEETRLLSHLVGTREAGGDVAGAWALEQQLVTHAMRNAHDLAVVPIFAEIAAKRRDTYEQYRAGALPPQIFLGCYYARGIYLDAVTLNESMIRTYTGAETGCRSGSRRTVLVALLMEIRAYQARAIDALLHNDGVASDELHALTTDMLRSSYELYALMPQHEDDLAARLFGNLLAAGPQGPVASRRRAELLIDLADYNAVRANLSGRLYDFDRVFEQYGQAFRQMADAGVDDATLQRYFFPDTPVRLPDFGRNQHPATVSPAAGPSPQRYADMAFELTSYGRAKHVEVLDASPDVPRSATRRLAREIRQTSFRPRLRDGRTPENAHVVVRYAIDH